jgi:hypothetical protein
MFMPDEPPAPAAPKTYSRQALVEKGMSKGWDRARAEAAADVKLARETAKVLDSAAPGEDFSAVARRSGELVPDVYMAPEEVSSMPVFPRQRVELPTTAPSAARPPPRSALPTLVPDAATRALLAKRAPPDPLVATSGYDVMGNIPFAPGPKAELRAERYLRPMSSLTPQEVRAINIAERAREDATAEQAAEEAGTTAKFLPPLGFAMGGPAGAAFGAGFGAFARPLASGMSRLMGNVGTQKPTDTELMLRMTTDGEKRSSTSPTSSEIAYTVPQKSLPSEAMDFTKDRATDFLFSSMAFPVAVSDTMMGIYTGAKDLAGELPQLSEQSFVVPAQKPQSLAKEAELASSWGSFPLARESERERATSARMFQQSPKEIVPLGNYNIGQSLFDVIDTPEGAVEKGLDTTPGFQMWEKENPVRAQQAREVVAAQKAARAPAERVVQREEVKQKTLDDYFSKRLLPPIELLAEYNLSPEEYEALQILGSSTGMSTEEGAIQLSSDISAEQARLFLRLSRDNPAKFKAHVEALRRSP